MPDPTPTTTPELVEGLDLDEQTANDVATLAHLVKQAGDIKDQVDEIKARLREHLTAGRRYRYGGVEVLDLAEPGQQFDAKLAATVIPAPLLAQVSVARPDADLCRRVLPADLYAACCKPKAAAVKPL